MKKKLIVALIMSFIVGSFFFVKGWNSKKSAETDPLATVLTQAHEYRQQGEYSLALELLNQLIAQGEKDPRLLKMWQQVLVENGSSQAEQKKLEDMRSKLISRAEEALVNKDYAQARSFANSASNLAPVLTATEEQKLQDIWQQLVQQELKKANREQKEGQFVKAQKILMDLLEEKDPLNKLAIDQQRQIRNEINRQLERLEKTRASDSQEQNKLVQPKRDAADQSYGNRQKVTEQAKRAEEKTEELALKEKSANELYSRGVQLYKQEKYQQALETFNQLLEQTEQPPRLHYARALSLRQLKQDDAAKTAFEEQIKREPEHSPSLWQLGELLINKDQMRAEQLLKQAIELKNDDPRYLRSLAALYFHQDRYKLAKLYYQQSLKLSDAAEDYFNLGVTHLREKNYHAASVSLEQALEKSSEPTIEMQLAFAQALYLSGNLKKAEEILKYLLTINKDEKTLSLLGKVYLEQQKYQQAEENLRLALDQAPENSSYLNDLALVLIEQKNYKKALSLLNQALEIEPTSALFHYNLAKVYLKLENFERSLAELKSSLALDTQQAEAHAALINLYLQLGQVKAAKKAYEEFKVNLPNARELASLAKQLNK